VTLRVGVVHEKASTTHIVRRESETQQSPFTTSGNLAGQVEKAGSQYSPLADDPNSAGLLQDELDVRICRVLDEPHGRQKAARVNLASKLSLHRHRRQQQRDGKRCNTQ
jgi:hypothetical protein